MLWVVARVNECMSEAESKRKKIFGMTTNIWRTNKVDKYIKQTLKCIANKSTCMHAKIFTSKYYDPPNNFQIPKIVWLTGIC